MKSIIKYFFIIMLSSFLLVFFVNSVGAIDFTPQIGIGQEFPAGTPKPITPTSIGQYIKAIYNYAIGIVGILAVVVMMVGGIIWMTAGGNAERAGNAKSWIAASITGLILVLCSFMILKTVNTNLVEFKPIDPKQAPTGNPSQNPPLDPPGIGVKTAGCCNSACTYPNVNSTNCNTEFGGAWYPDEEGFVYKCNSDNTCTKDVDKATNCCQWQTLTAPFMQFCDDKYNTQFECTTAHTGGIFYPGKRCMEVYTQFSCR